MKLILFCFLTLVFLNLNAHAWETVISDTDMEPSSIQHRADSIDSDNWKNVLDDPIKNSNTPLVPKRDSLISDRELGVGVVVVAIPDKYPEPIGTAWVFNSNMLATNAHVAVGIVNELEKLKDEEIKGARAYYLPNKSKGESFEIVDIFIHPDYGRIPINVHGKRPINDPDVALLEVAGPLKNHLTIATSDELHQLKAGESVQYIGFPMENLAGDNINLNSLVATTQTGTITALSDWWLGDSGPEKNKVIRHDMGLTGGASGSPIFNTKGHVIALANAGNMIGQVQNDKVVRAPSAAMINFGIRVDLLHDLTE